jgi:putative DNA primase/helicase
VHRVGGRFAILEAALLLGRDITGWDEQTCRDAIQHSYNAWIGVFGTGNKEVEQIIEQAMAFLSSYGMSRFAPLPYDELSLPIHNLAGYRDKGGNQNEPVSFYVLPAAFKTEVAKGFDASSLQKRFSKQVLKNQLALTVIKH